MTLRINFNLSAALTQLSLNRTTDDLSTSMMRLSSGTRINRAADDPAGLTIADTMRHVQVALAQASSNGEHGVSLLQTADGSMDSISAMLNKMRGLAVQAANEGAQDQPQLAALQQEFDAGAASITDIASNAQFGSLHLLQGDLGGLTIPPAAQAAFGAASFDATRLPAGIQDASSLTLAPPSGNLTHDRVQVMLTDASSNPPPKTAPITGLTQNGAATPFSIAGSTALTLTGPSGTQTVTLTAATSIDDFVNVVNSGTARTGLRAAYDPTSGALTVESAGFGGGALNIAGADLTGGGNIGLLDTDTTSATANPLQAPPDTYAMTLTNPATATVAAATDPIISLVDAGPGAALDAATGKTITLYGQGSSVALTLTATTTVQDVVDWVNTTGSTVGARAAFDPVTGALSITGTRGPLGVSAQDMTSANLQIGLMDERTDLMASNDLNPLAPVKTATAANQTMGVTFTDASGVSRTVTLTQDPTSPGGLTFTNLTPGPELSPPYSGWESGALRVTLKDPTAGAFGATLTAPAAATTITRQSTMVLQLGAFSGQQRVVEIPDMRTGALGQSAFRAEYASTAASKPLVQKGYRSLQDLVGMHALTNGDATEAIRMIDAAISEVAAARGRAGALQSDGVQTTLDTLQVSSDNLVKSESQIRDTDFAAETANVTRLQIMMQAATAMLAQANQVPQSVLQLLRQQ